MLTSLLDQWVKGDPNEETARMKLLLALLVVLGISISPVSAETKRVLVFGDSNTWGSNVDGVLGIRRQLAPDERYGGQLEANLDGQVDVVVDGVVGRTTDVLPGSGDGSLERALEKDGPFDLVVIMLGTNDLRAGIERSPEETAQAVMTLGRFIAERSDRTTPTKVLVVSPPPLADTSNGRLDGLFRVAIDPSALLGDAIETASKQNRFAFFDAGSVVPFMGGRDGVHMSVSQHATLGKALAPVVRGMLERAD